MRVNHLTIARLPVDPTDDGAVDEALQAAPRHAIDQVNWPCEATGVSATFGLGHTGSELLLHYRVEEPTVLAEKTRTNDPVCQDSCVEMFFAPRAGVYLNLECNAIGTMLVGRGSCREDSCTIAPARIDRIRRWGSLGTKPFAERPSEGAWTLTAVVPLEVLELPAEVSGQTYRANFYKCGDHLSQPHYRSWNPIDSESPDFHRPECFGEVTFE